MKQSSFKIFVSLIFLLISCGESATSVDPENTTQENTLPDISGYPIVSTAQSKCYNNSNEISSPSIGSAFYGQDANYSKNEPQYQDNADGTVTDLVTGLMWSQSPDMDG